MCAYVCNVSVCVWLYANAERSMAMIKNSKNKNRFVKTLSHSDNAR